VMQGSGYSSAKTGCDVADDEGVMREINALTMTILSKVLFMREPWLQEPEFIRYQTEEVRVLLNRLRGGESEW